MADAQLPELERLERIIRRLGDRARCQVVDRIRHRQLDFPIHCITLGSDYPETPTLAFFGGVHGLEKIGSEVLLSYLETICGLLDWDGEFAARLQRSRLLFMPIVNPVGVYVGTRANGNGVDLMRNAPVEGEGANRLYCGHRLSRHLPWYRGNEEEMEPEALALCRVVERALFGAQLSIALDLHSGFGIRDRLWFPYASRQTPFAFLAETMALKNNFDRCYPNHIYKFEPTSAEYLINGDLWDYLFDRFMAQNKDRRLFLPLTLEMGSWLWLRKSPLQLFSRYGLFHPLRPHRQQRIQRRHFLLFDFLHRSLLFPEFWISLSVQQQESHLRQALELWYK